MNKLDFLVNMLAIVISASALLLGVGTVSAGKCPDMSQFRSEFVKESFDPASLEGLWYVACTHISFNHIRIFLRTLHLRWRSGRLGQPT
jgi:hypothetical protein